MWPFKPSRTPQAVTFAGCLGQIQSSDQLRLLPRHAVFFIQQEQPEFVHRDGFIVGRSARRLLGLLWESSVTWTTPLLCWDCGVSAGGFALARSRGSAIHLLIVSCAYPTSGACIAFVRIDYTSEPEPFSSGQLHRPVETVHEEGHVRHLPAYAPACNRATAAAESATSQRTKSLLNSA